LLLSDLCACVFVKKNGVVKETIVLDELVHCSVKNGAKTIVKESRKFELARLKKKKRRRRRRQRRRRS